VSEQLIYVRGNANGYFKPKVWNQSGVFSFYNIDFKTIDIKNSEIIEPFVFNELKVDLYNQPINSSQTVKVFIDDTNYIQDDISEILFTEIKIGESITVHGENFVEYDSIVYFTIKKIIPEKIVVPIKRTVLQKYLPITDTLSNWNQVTVDPVISLEEPIIAAAPRVNSVFFSSLFGSLIFSLLGFFFLKMLFGLSFFTLSLPILFFIMMMMGALKNRFPSFNNHIGVQNNFWNKCGWLLIILGCYFLYESYSVKICVLLISLGASLLLAVRNNVFLKWMGRIGLIISCFLLFVLLKPHLDTSKSETKNNSDNTTVDNERNKWDYTPEEVKETVQIDNNDTVRLSYLTHKLNWNDNYQNPYKGEFKVRKDYFNITRIERNQIEPAGQGFRNQCSQIYRQMVNQSKNYLDSVIKVYASIGKKNNLNNKMFADMIVTSVQNIPYCLVHDLTHAEADRQYGGFITEYHQSGGPCLSEMKFGVQAPVEFMANLKGDCDTRSVFLYYILSKLGYSVVVLGSEHYSHAILGISGNYSGDCVKYNALNYYVWETTATGFTPGNLSPTISNMRYWDVVLANTN
jgi:hypothetical protein